MGLQTTMDAGGGNGLLSLGPLTGAGGTGYPIRGTRSNIKAFKALIEGNTIFSIKFSFPPFWGSDRLGRL